MNARRLLPLFLLMLLAVAPQLGAQCVSLAALGATYSQNFNTLALSGTSNLVPAGWAFSESGTAANATYTAGTGSGTGGDTYSFGSAASSERAFGGLLSNALTPTIGACFTNNTGGVVQSLAVAYTGEEWRLGAAGRADRLDFQFSVDASALNNGTWTDVNALDFSTPNTSAAIGALDGNAAANRTAISATITGLTIPAGATFWIRWTDLNVTGSDDGLAVDDFSLTPGGVAQPNISIDDVSANEGNSGTTTFHFTVSLSSAALAPVTFNIATADVTATAGSDYVARSLTSQTIPTGSSTYGFDVTVNGDTARESDEIFVVNLSGVSGATVTDGQGAGKILNDDAGIISISAVNTAFTENFDSLATTGTANSSTPNGWSINETGGGARDNEQYAADNGGSSTGDTYSYGTTASTDRAFGTLASGSLTPTIGAQFQNNTGVVINTLSIAYTGEEWHLGTAGRTDQLDFQFSTDATSLTTGTWTDVNALDFVTPNTTGPTGALDGNAAANRRFVSFTMAGLSIPPGATFWIRYADTDDAGSDDGLAVDDFSIIANIAGGVLTINDVSVIEGDSGTTTAHFVVSLSQPAGPSGVTFDIGTADGTATTADNDYVARALTGQFIPPGASSYSFDVTVNGDTNIEPTETFSVDVTNVFGAAVNDGHGVGTILADDFIFTPIHDVQGSGPTSPFNGSTVTVGGIVTGIKQGSSGGYFVQTVDADVDADPNTSEGIFVFTGASVPAGVAIGNRVAVTGVVQEFPAASAPYTTTELTSSSVSVLATGQPLPAPTVITVADGTATSNINQYERFEGMRVATTLTVVAPTQGTLIETSATSTSNGVFYGVVQGVPRPFREPGIPTTDPVPPEAPCGACIPRFDMNPELLRVDSDIQPGATQLNVAAGQTVSNVVGELDFGFNQYSILPEAAAVPTVSGSSTYIAVPAAAPTEVTVGSYNLERFYDTIDDAATSDVVLTSTAFNNRLNKASLAIRNVLRTPDVVAVVEMENINALTALANEINGDAVAAGDPNPNYQPYLMEGNDIGGIDVGFLVKPSRVTAISVTQEGKDTTWVQPDGVTAILNDRPSLVLVGEAHRPDSSPFRFTVIVNHLRSLSGVNTDDAEGRRIRAKRRAQAEWLAGVVQLRQVENPSERILLVGDFNAFQFSDGLVDVIGTIKGTPAPANEVVLSSPVLVSPPLTNLIESMEPADERYSFSFDGNAQAIDHALANSVILPWIAQSRHARVDTDFPEAFRGTSTRPERISDHDAIVVYMNVPAAQLSLTAPASATYGTAFTVTVTARDEVGNVETNYRGTVTFSSSLAATLPASYTFTAADNGVHTFTILPRAAGANTITVTSTAGPSANAIVQVNPAPLTITADNKSATFGAAIPPFTATYTGLVAGDTPTSLGAPNYACAAAVGSPVGTYPIQVSGVSSPNYTITFADGTLTITPASTSLSVAAVSGQYSDTVTLSAAVSPATLASQHADGTVTFSVAGSPVGSSPVAVDGTATVALNLDRAPGSYAIYATYSSGNPNFSGSNGGNTLTVTQEDAVPTYSGVLFASTSSASSGTAVITLRATVQDISAVTSSIDLEPGSLVHATATFVDLDTNTPISPALPIGNLDATNTTGSVSFDWTADIGAADSQTFHIGVVVSGWYTGSDDVLITVSRPSTEGVNGGGYVVNTHSAGALAGDAASKTNFGFNAQFNKNGSNLQGHVTVIIRSGGHVYQVKGNPSSLAGVPSTGHVTLVSKVQVKEGNSAIDTNATLEISMSDNGEPGDGDTIGITLWSKSGALLYSSHWTGAQTAEQVLGGGNLQVH